MECIWVWERPLNFEVLDAGVGQDSIDHIAGMCEECAGTPTAMPSLGGFRDKNEPQKVVELISHDLQWVRQQLQYQADQLFSVKGRTRGRRTCLNVRPSIGHDWNHTASEHDTPPTLHTTAMLRATPLVVQFIFIHKSQCCAPSTLSCFLSPRSDQPGQRWGSSLAITSIPLKFNVFVDPAPRRPHLVSKTSFLHPTTCAEPADVDDVGDDDLGGPA